MSESINKGTYKKTSPTNYYTVQNWMTHECGLKYPQRDIYAILHGFTQDREQWVEPTQAYIAELVGVSRQCINENIAQLEKDGWLRKVTRIIPGRGTRSSYQTVLPEERNLQQGVSTSVTGGVNQDDTRCQPASQGVSTTLTGGVNQDDTDNKKIIKPISNTIINTHEPAQQATIIPLTTSTKVAEATPPCVSDAELESLFSQLESAYSKIKKFDGTKLRKKALKALGFFLASNPYGLNIGDLMKAVERRYEAERDKPERYRTNLYSWLDDEKYLTDLRGLKAYAHLFSEPSEQPAEETKSESKLASPERIPEVRSLIHGNASESGEEAEDSVYPDTMDCPLCGAVDGAVKRAFNVYRCRKCDQFSTQTA